MIEAIYELPLLLRLLRYLCIAISPTLWEKYYSLLAMTFLLVALKVKKETADIFFTTI